MAGTGLVLICVFMDLNLVSVHEKATKKRLFWKSTTLASRFVNKAEILQETFVVKNLEIF